MLALVDSVECGSCGGQHSLCVAPDNYSPGALYEFFCPRTNQTTSVALQAAPSPAVTCPPRMVYAKRVER